MSYQDGHIDRIIREAQERGEFDDLPGTGKPLDLGDAGDPDWWVKRWVRREGIDTSATLPPALALRRERETFPGSLADLGTEASARAVLEDYNRRVREERLMTTFGALPRPITATVDVEELLAQWRDIKAAQREAAAAQLQSSVEQAVRRRWWQRRR